MRLENRDALNVFILAVFAISQPLFSLLGNNPLFFSVRHSDYKEVVLFTFLLGVFVPGLAALICFLAYRVQRHFGRVISTALIGLCVILILAPLLNQLSGISGKISISLTLLIALATTVLYVVLPVIRTFTTYLAPAVVVFPIAFLLNPDIAHAVGKSSASSDKQRITAPSSVVLLLFDALPIHSLLNENHEIDAVRFPNFAQLAEESSWYRRASTVNSATAWAVPSLLTGRELYGAVPTPLHLFFPSNLFTALGKQYELRVTEYISRLCPAELCPHKYKDSSDYLQSLKGLLSDVAILYLHSVIPRDFSGHLPRINETFGGFAKGNIQSKEEVERSQGLSPKVQVEEFVDSLRLSDKPQLYFLHLLLPHAPWRYLPSGKEYGDGYYAQIHGLNGLTKRWSKDIWAFNVAYQRHLLQVAFVDKVVGEAVQRLKDIGLYDETMLIVLSDHGGSYKANDNHRQVTEGNKADLIGVPLFIKYPNQKAGIIDDRNVSIIDVLPTVLDQLGAQVPWAMDGASLLGGEFPDRNGKAIRGLKKKVFYTAEDFYADSTTVQDKFRLLATGEPIDDLFNISLEPSLNGLKLADLAIAPGIDEFQIHYPNQFDHVDLASNYLPAFVSGQAPSLKPGTALAVALNGKIVTVSRVFYGAAGHHKFAAMLPESEFRQGKNVLSIHRIEVEEGAHRLYQSSIQPLTMW